MYSDILQVATMNYELLNEHGITSVKFNESNEEITVQINDINLFDELVQNRELQYVHHVNQRNAYEVNFKQFRYGRTFKFLTRITEHQYLEHKKSRAENTTY